MIRLADALFVLLVCAELPYVLRQVGSVEEKHESLKIARSFMLHIFSSFAFFFVLLV